jgi:hypothetical protein
MILILEIALGIVLGVFLLSLPGRIRRRREEKMIIKLGKGTPSAKPTKPASGKSTSEILLDTPDRAGEGCGGPPPGSVFQQKPLDESKAFSLVSSAGMLDMNTPGHPIKMYDQFNSPCGCSYHLKYGEPLPNGDRPVKLTKVGCKDHPEPDVRTGIAVRQSGVIHVDARESK